VGYNGVGFTAGGMAELDIVYHRVSFRSPHPLNGVPISKMLLTSPLIPSVSSGVVASMTSSVRLYDLLCSSPSAPTKIRSHPPRPRPPRPSHPLSTVQATRPASVTRPLEHPPDPAQLHVSRARSPAPPSNAPPARRTGGDGTATVVPGRTNTPDLHSTLDLERNRYSDQEALDRGMDPIPGHTSLDRLVCESKRRSGSEDEDEAEDEDDRA